MSHPRPQQTTASPVVSEIPVNSDVADGKSGSPSAIPAEGSELLEIETQALMRNFQKAIETSVRSADLFDAIFNIVAEETNCLALWRVQVAADDQPLRASAISDDNANALWLSIEHQLTDVVNASEHSDQICSATILPDRKHALVAAPLTKPTDSTACREVLTGCFSHDAQSVLRLQWLMGIASQSVNQWVQIRQTSSAQKQSQTLNEALQLIDSIGETKNTTESAITIVNALRRLFAADQVAMATVKKGKPTLAAISDVEKLDINSDNSGLLKSAISQTLATGATVAFPNENPSLPAANLLPLKNWCQANAAEAVFNLPMMLENGEPVGALLVTYSQSVPDVNTQAYLDKIAGLIAKQFSLARRVNLSTTEAFTARLSTCAPTLKKGIIATLLFASLMAIPWPYRVQCDCQVQPTQRRFVAAPYDGILEKSLVDVGEVVTKDQVIARLEGRQLRIELAGLQAEYEGAKRRRDSSLATREIAQSQIAGSEMKRLAAQIELLNDRMRDLEVRSPTDGVIVAGDMEKVQGAPLEMGQTLFEVAPLETMVAEIGIPENEIHYVKKDDFVTIKVNSFPFQSWEGKICQIHPSAEIVSDNTVFIADVEIENQSGALRPGMEGSAKITTRWSPIGWNLFHNAWESVRYWTIW